MRLVFEYGSFAAMGVFTAVMDYKIMSWEFWVPMIILEVGIQAAKWDRTWK